MRTSGSSRARISPTCFRADSCNCTRRLHSRLYRQAHYAVLQSARRAQSDRRIVSSTAQSSRLTVESTHQQRVILTSTQNQSTRLSRSLKSTRPASTRLPPASTRLDGSYRRPQVDNTDDPPGLYPTAEVPHREGVLRWRPMHAGDQARQGRAGAERQCGHGQQSTVGAHPGALVHARCPTATCSPSGCAALWTSASCTTCCPATSCQMEDYPRSACARALPRAVADARAGTRRRTPRG